MRLCLNEVEGLADATVTAQKILSCVARAGERFGAEHIVDVLLGANTERVRRWRHKELSTYGLMKGTNRKTLINMLYQLLDDGLLERTAEERPVFDSTTDPETYCVANARCVLQPKAEVSKTRFDEQSWEGVTTDYSRAFEFYGDKSPTSGTCPRMSCSATRFARHGTGPARISVRIARYSRRRRTKLADSDRVSLNSS